MVVITLRVKMTRSNTFTMRWNLIKHSESFLISVVIWVWSKIVISNDWLRSITNLLNKGSIVKCKIFIWVSKNVRNQHRLRIQVFAMNEIPSGVIHPHQSQRKCSLRLSLALCSSLCSSYSLLTLLIMSCKTSCLILPSYTRRTKICKVFTILFFPFLGHFSLHTH